MRFSGRSILVLLLLLCCNAVADDKPAATSVDSVVIKATQARCWDQGDTSVVELTGPVHIEMNGAKMSAQNAVVWIEPNPHGLPDSHKLQIALIGNVQLQQAGVLRFDRRLLVNAEAPAAIQLIGTRTTGADEESDLYIDAADLRAGRATTRPIPTTGPGDAAVSSDTAPPATATTQTQHDNNLLPGGITPLPGLEQATRPSPATGRASTAPSSWLKAPANPATAPGERTTETVPTSVLEFDGDYDRATTSDGNLAAVVSNGVSLSYRDANKNLIEFTAKNMVLFTNLKDMKGLGSEEDSRHFISDHIVSAYFEGDVQVFYTPSSASTNELRMRAEHVYYEFATDRAIMTDVVFHTVDLKKQLPIFMRAAKLRQLSLDEFNFDNVELTDSAFAAPTYSIRASHAYVRAEDSGDERTGERIAFEADNTTINAVGVPFFYFPAVSGTMDSRGFPLRSIAFNNDHNFGVGARARLGLFETIGVIPPKDLDVSYVVDYLSRRGPAGGIDANYSGGFVSDTTGQPWNFRGDFRSFFVDDHGTDVLGAARNNETPTDHLRGRLFFEHQHFFPDDWQAQVRLGYVSDSNFMAQWFNDEYQNGLPVDESVYLRHAKDSEVFTFLVEAQPNRAISTADEEQQNREISKLPEISYQRIGDSLADDHLTFFSENSGSIVKFVRNTQSLTQQGFFPGIEPGLASYAYTGDPGRTTFRGDFRQEVDYPINAGVVKVVPYLFVRDTPYSQSVIPGKTQPQTNTIPPYVQHAGALNRLMAGGGARLTTSFWKTDNTIESDILDIHRLRHVIEPELNVFASTANVGQDRVFIYDPQVDGINDVTAVQLALRQRWQTKRGGPGRWRSADVFTLDLYGNFFAKQPRNRFRDPIDFRGLYFYGQPETSIPRNSANADATWRVSDSTTVLASVEQNLDKVRLATASIGVAVMRDQRLSYFVGTRYIADLNSNVITFEANYKLDDKYSLSASQSINLTQNQDMFYDFSLTRTFDNLSMVVRFYYDQSTSNQGFSFSLQPFGFGKSVNADQTGVQQ